MPACDIFKKKYIVHFIPSAIYSKHFCGNTAGIIDDSTLEKLIRELTKELVTLDLVQDVNIAASIWLRSIHVNGKLP